MSSLLALLAIRAKPNIYITLLLFMASHTPVDLFVIPPTHPGEGMHLLLEAFTLYSRLIPISAFNNLPDSMHQSTTFIKKKIIVACYLIRTLLYPNHVRLAFGFHCIIAHYNPDQLHLYSTSTVIPLHPYRPAPLPLPTPPFPHNWTRHDPQNYMSWGLWVVIHLIRRRKLWGEEICPPTPG